MHIISENQIILVSIVLLEANFVKFSIGFGDSIPYINKPWCDHEVGQMLKYKSAVMFGQRFCNYAYI